MNPIFKSDLYKFIDKNQKISQLEEKLKCIENITVQRYLHDLDKHVKELSGQILKVINPDKELKEYKDE